MSRIVRSTVSWAVIGGLSAGVALLVGVDRTDLVGDAYLVLLAFLIALAAARIAGAAFPRPRGIVPGAIERPPRRPTVPDSLRRMEDVVALGQADRFDLHFRLRPVLQEIVAGALPGHVAQGERSFSAVTWALIRPDRSRPEGERSRGIDTESLTAVVTELEAMVET